MTADSSPARPRRPSLAVWKFASCDGCQLTLLDCEDELLQVAEAVDLRYFLEAGVVDAVGGPYDVSIVEGSVTTPEDRERIQRVREASRTLVTIGACATAGGIQALRNLADIREYMAVVYATPSFVSTLAESTPIGAHVPVDVELRGCPVSKRQLLTLITALLAGRRAEPPSYSVCVECKQRHNRCVMVAGGQPCLGPVTHAGCDALCPSYHRGCYGCYGPAGTADAAAVASLARELRDLGLGNAALSRLLRTFNAAAEPFAQVSAEVGPRP